MKKKLSYAIAITALTMFFSVRTFAQQTVAHMYKDAPITKTEKTATFQVVLDNIDNDQERMEYLNRFKACKAITSVTPSDLQDKKVTYTVTMDQEGIFYNFQNALAICKIENVDFLGKSISTAQFGQAAQMEYGPKKDRSSK